MTSSRNGPTSLTLQESTRPRLQGHLPRPRPQSPLHRRFLHPRARQRRSAHRMLRKPPQPLHGSRANATAGRHPRFPAPLLHLRRLSQDRLPLLLRLHRHYVGFPRVSPGNRRRCLSCVGTAMKARKRRSPSMRVTTTRTLPRLFLTRMLSRPTSVTQAWRRPCPRGRRRSRHHHLLLLSLSQRPREQARPRFRASLHRRPGNLWICPGQLRLRLHHPRRRPDLTKSMTLTTTPRRHMGFRPCRPTPCRRLLPA
jgi:hypothetical protein